LAPVVKKAPEIAASSRELVITNASGAAVRCDYGGGGGDAEGLGAGTDGCADAALEARRRNCLCAVR
jgi:hypothetical protein